MKILVQVKTNAKIEKVEPTGDQAYKIWVKVPPVEGKANAAVVKLLAKHFGVVKTKVNILSGFKAKRKIIQIGE